MGNGLKNLLTVLWVGGMWIVGAVVAPVLFHAMTDGSAMVMTDKMLRIVGWIGIVAGIYLLIWWIWVDGLKSFQTGRFWLIIGMLACTLINQFAVFPILASIKPAMSQATEGMFGGGLSGWRTISSLIYLLQSVLGVIYVWGGESK
jgi:hypothetical protein